MIINIEKFNTLKSNIKLLILDVDGTLTDGKIYMGDNGEVFKAFDIKDGYAIHNILPKRNITPVIITARTSNIVLNRCKELGITDCYQGVSDKLQKLRELASKYGLECNDKDIFENIAYMGDDIIDIKCMKHCGLIACPNNAIKQVKEISDFISEYNGGDGAVREFIDCIIQ